MLDGLLDFLIDIPGGGYMIESSYCADDECNSYVGNIDPSNIWKFNLSSLDGNSVKEFEASVEDFFEPRICLSVDDNGEKVDFNISPKNCNLTEDGVLCIDGNNRDHKLKLFIKKY
ncbi:MAG: hypothetical protein LJI21_02490 [Wolbachia endosymbiont of Menacanthus eurysternus]|nr:MAG: hypothetical protein LJI21_02490 [Wolbachia endosymbiont of Menacanthus eurysternus]